MPDESPDSLPVAAIEHRIPGRMRLRLVSRRSDTDFFQRVATALCELPGVHRADINPRTGSILVVHGGDEETVLAAARERRLFLASPPAHSVVPAASLSRPGAAPLPRSPLDLASWGLAAAGFVQLLRGQAVGSASENLWNAYALYLVTRRALPSAVLVAFGLLQIGRGQALGSATSLFLYAFSARSIARNPGREESIR